MKKWYWVGWLAFIMVIGFGIWASDTAEKEKIMKWSFDSDAVGSVPAGWMIAETSGDQQFGAWKVMEMNGAPSGKQVFALAETTSPNSTFNLAIQKNAHFKDIDITLKLKPLSGKIDQGGGPIWRVIDSNNYYIARWNPLENNFRVYIVKEGKRKQLANYDIQTDASQWHEIHIKMVGKQIQASFDGKKVMDVEDATFPEAGMIGLWTKADAATAFDDLVMKETD